MQGSGILEIPAITDEDGGDVLVPGAEWIVGRTLCRDEGGALESRGPEGGARPGLLSVLDEDPDGNQRFPRQESTCSAFPQSLAPSLTLTCTPARLGCVLRCRMRLGPGVNPVESGGGAGATATQGSWHSARAGVVHVAVHLWSI